jgi:hypothetical protein
MDSAMRIPDFAKLTLVSGSWLILTLITRLGWHSSVGIATCYGLDGPGNESRWGARFSAPVQTGPEAHPAPYTMGTGSFPGLKRPGHDVDHLSPSSAEDKERVELYPYSPSGPSWPVLGRTLPLPNFKNCSQKMLFCLS